MTGYIKLDRSYVLEDAESKDTPAKVAKVANPSGTTASDASVVDSATLLKFAKVANRDGDTEIIDPARPLPPGFPCVVCGGGNRWDDAGIWRCVACWPTPLTQQTMVAERAYQHTTALKDGRHRPLKKETPDD